MFRVGLGYALLLSYISLYLKNIPQYNVDKNFNES